MSFQGKIALITGASSGIGAQTAVHFAREKCHLSIVGRNEVNLEKTKNSCIENGLSPDHILTLIADLSKEEDIKRVLDETISRFGQLNILVNSAGILVNGTTENTSLTSFDQCMNINVRSAFYLTQLSIPHLIKTKGNIVNVSSVTGLRAFPGVVAYNMSKAALDQLTRTSSLELAAEGVRVNAVNPGVIITEVHKRGGMDDSAYALFLEKSKSTHAMGRVGNTSEVADAILFLASNKASFITGINLPIDGGRSIMCPR